METNQVGKGRFPVSGVCNLDNNESLVLKGIRHAAESSHVRRGGNLYHWTRPFPFIDVPRKYKGTYNRAPPSCNTCNVHLIHFIQVVPPSNDSDQAQAMAAAQLLLVVCICLLGILS